MWIIFIWLHNLSTSVTHCCWLSYNSVMVKWLPTTETRSHKTVVVCNTPSLFFLCTLLEEDLPKNVLLLVEGVIILDVVVMRLIEDTV